MVERSGRENMHELVTTVTRRWRTLKHRTARWFLPPVNQTRSKTPRADKPLATPTARA